MTTTPKIDRLDIFDLGLDGPAESTTDAGSEYFLIAIGGSAKDEQKLFDTFYAEFLKWLGGRNPKGVIWRLRPRRIGTTELGLSGVRRVQYRCRCAWEPVILI